MCEHGRGLDGGRSRAEGTGKAASCGSSGGGDVAYAACGYKQGWADGMAGKTGMPTAQIEPKWLTDGVNYCVRPSDVRTTLFAVARAGN